jgi:hypothetical protein
MFMDRLRTLLLARTSMVVLDADRVASAATRPQRDVDVEKFEDELAQLGVVMSLDLAMTMRRLPHAVGQELKAWMLATLSTGARPQVPLAPSATQRSLYQRRMMTWLATRAEQPCPWCGEVKASGALDPCGHLVCRACWEGGNFAGCPICHRRVTASAPFVAIDPAAPRVIGAEQLRTIDLALDPVAVAKDRFQRMLSRATPLTAEDREELELVIDVMGPRVAGWLPPKIAVTETLAVALARFWLGAPDRAAMVRATQAHVKSATDVLRIAVVLMGGEPALAEPMRLKSIPRSLRRAVLQALDKLPLEAVLEEMRRRVGLWKRVGERLHPFEHAAKLPNSALAFAAIRGSTVAALGFDVKDRAPRNLVIGETLAIVPWGGPVEAALRARDPVTALARLSERPEELLQRVDQLLALDASVLAGIQAAIPKGTPTTLLVLMKRSKHAIVVEDIRRELLARAETCRRFARAVIDRALVSEPILLEIVTRARPSVWELAAIHAAARANVVYIRELDGTVTTIRRRDQETSLARLARIHGNPDQDSQFSRIPPADAPTFVALQTADLPIPKNSAGYVLVPRHSLVGFTRLAACDLVAELAPK